MLVQDNAQTNLAGIANDLIHQWEPTEPLQIGIESVVNASGFATRVKELIGVGKTNGIIMQALDLIQHVLITAHIQAMHNIVGRLETKPVNPCNTHWLIVSIQDLRPTGMPVALPK